MNERGVFSIARNLFVTDPAGPPATSPRPTVPPFIRSEASFGTSAPRGANIRPLAWISTENHSPKKDLTFVAPDRSQTVYPTELRAHSLWLPLCSLSPDRIMDDTDFQQKARLYCLTQVATKGSDLVTLFLSSLRAR